MDIALRWSAHATLWTRPRATVLVDGYHALIPALTLPDTDDRHVLVAAIVGRCDVIVTQNRADFPAQALEPFGIDVQPPDEFLVNHLHLAPGVFCIAVRKVCARFKNPPYSVDAYLGTLIQLGLVATAAELNGFAELL
ncbi:hypothetical protein ACUSIJ_28255 [Pseudochelatococcus sp. B33]